MTNGMPCEPPSCNECEYCSPEEVWVGDDYVWKHYCDLAGHGGRAIEMDEGECCPEWCPLVMIDKHNED